MFSILGSARPAQRWTRPACGLPAGNGSGMSDGFQVTMTGLQQVAGVFRAEAGTFAAIMPSGGPASVDGGSAEINDALSLFLGAVGWLHTQPHAPRSR